MQTLTAEEFKLKLIFKAAIIEVLEERRDLLIDALEEALEEIALLDAIKQGESSPVVPRDQVFALLEG